MKFLQLFSLLFLCLFLVVPSLISQEKEVLQRITIGGNVPQSGTAVLNGLIKDGKNGELIAGAVLQFLDHNVNDISEEDGSYTLSANAGIYNLTVSFLGYEDYEVEVVLNGSGDLNISLLTSALNLDEVTVTDRRGNDNLRSAIGGIEKLDIEQIEQKSKFLGETDVLRSIQSLSGVSSAGEGASGFNVRGGNADENLIFQDDAFIINPVHALGFFSLFHPDLVKGITLYKGDVPAKYGGRLSSVLDVRLREGDSKRFAAEGGIGVGSSRLTLEGPIIKDKVTFIVGGRASYFDWLLNRIDDLDLRKSKAFFYDLTGKLDARITNTTKLGGTFFTAFDAFQFAEEVKFEYETKTSSVYLDQIVGDNININARMNIGQYSSSLFDLDGNNQSEFNNKVDYLRGGISMFYQMRENLTLEIGAESNNYEVSPGSFKPVGDGSIAKPVELDIEKGNETAVYLQQTFNLGEKLEIIAGIRYVNYRSVGPDDIRTYQENVPKRESSVTGTTSYSDNETIIAYSGLEPRFSMRFSIDETSSFKLGYNRANQYFSQISNTASATPVDIWQLSNIHVGPQRADNFSIGYYKNFRDNTLSTEFALFYRKIDNVIEYRDFATLLLNKNIETELLSGLGKAYGAELSISKNYGNHRFEGNYTFSRSLRRIPISDSQESINNGKWFSSNTDKPHVFNLNYNYKMGEKSNLSFNFTYSTGRPTTAPVSSYANSNIGNIPIYSNRNAFRIPDFHRLDVSYTIGPWGNGEYRENSLTLSIYNVYARKNAFSVFFRQEPFQRVKAFRIAVLGSAFPAITYNFKF